MAFTLPIRAQTELWRHTSVSCSYWFDIRQFPVGDLDGDRHIDFATPVATWAGCNERMAIWNWSGRTGAQIGAPVAMQMFFFRALGDVDRDGVMDYLGSILPPNPRSVEAHSGRIGQVLWSVPGTWNYLGEIDVNSDGVPDCAMANGSAINNHGTIEVREGGTGGLLYRLDGVPSVYSYYPTLAHVGDMDQDGVADFAVGVSWIQAFQGDAIAVISGRLGQPIRVGVGDPRVSLVHTAVSGAGDVDRDGIPDFAGAGAGGAVIFAGRTGAIIQRIGPYPGSSFGVSLVGGEDLDQDGCGDLIAGGLADNADPRDRLQAVSGRDGSLLWEIRSVGPTIGTGLGYPGSARMLPPQPGSPFPLVVVTESNAYGGGGTCCGYVSVMRVFRSSPPGVDAYGTACAPSQPAPPRVGIRSLATGARITIVDAPPGGTAVLLLGTSNTQFAGTPLPWVLDPWGLPGCQLLTSIDLSVPRTLGTAGIDRGYAAVDLPVRLMAPGAATRRLYAQWVTLDAQNALVGVSQALSLTVR